MGGFKDREMVTPLGKKYFLSGGEGEQSSVEEEKAGGSEGEATEG